jgi:hypothetical protein
MQSHRLDYITLFHLSVIDVQKDPDAWAAHLLDQPHRVRHVGQGIAAMVDLDVQIFQAEHNIVLFGQLGYPQGLVSGDPSGSRVRGDGIDYFARRLQFSREEHEPAAAHAAGDGKAHLQVLQISFHAVRTNIADLQARIGCHRLFNRRDIGARAAPELNHESGSRNFFDTRREAQLAKNSLGAHRQAIHRFLARLPDREIRRS